MTRQSAFQANAVTPVGASKNYKWIVVGLLWAVCLFNYADRQAIFSVFTVLREEMHLSDFQLGIVGSSFMWVYALAGPLAGAVGDRVSRRTLVIGGLIFWSLVTIATAVSTKYWHLVLFRALEGFGADDDLLDRERQAQRRAGLHLEPGRKLRLHFGGVRVRPAHDVAALRERPR